jgi:hypothetical protein
MYACPILSGFGDRAISLHTSKIVVSTVSNTSIYCSSDKVGTGTYYNTFSKSPLSASVHFAAHVRTWRVAHLSIS